MDCASYCNQLVIYEGTVVELAGPVAELLS